MTTQKMFEQVADRLMKSGIFGNELQTLEMNFIFEEKDNEGEAEIDNYYITPAIRGLGEGLAEHQFQPCGFILVNHSRPGEVEKMVDILVLCNPPRERDLC